MFITVELVEDEEISFYHKRSCDYYAKLEFYVDDEKITEWRGNNATPTEWEKYTYLLPKGIHTLKWTYNKRVADPKADDCVFLDNIVLPPLSIITFVSPVSNLEAKVEESNVTLTWDASENAREYVIMRNDEQIAVQKETIFTDSINQSGTYTYSVIAKKYDGYAEPVTVTVEVLNVNEINVNRINVYPNPATDIVYVDVDESFNAVIYNYQGQVVKNVIVDNGQIDLSSFTAGVYFIEIRANNNVMIEKIILTK